MQPFYISYMLYMHVFISFLKRTVDNSLAYSCEYQYRLIHNACYLLQWMVLVGFEFYVPSQLVSVSKVEGSYHVTNIPNPNPSFIPPQTHLSLKMRSRPSRYSAVRQRKGIHALFSTASVGRAAEVPKTKHQQIYYWYIRGTKHKTQAMGFVVFLR